MKTNVASFEGKKGNFLVQFLTNPIALQRLEGLVVLIGSLWAWHTLGGNWWAFVLLLLTPDLTLLGYLINPKIGAALYNLIHSYPLSALALGIGLAFNLPWLALAGVLVLAHIGMDRTVGYGLKLASGFKDTHLGQMR